jgi:hypothetical protein
VVSRIFFENKTEALVLKSVTMGIGLSQMVHNYVTSFMNDSLMLFFETKGVSKLRRMVTKSFKKQVELLNTS